MVLRLLSLALRAEASEEQRVAQRSRQAAVGGDSAIGEGCYVAGSAAAFADRLWLGDRSYIAAHAYVTGELTTGRAESTAQNRPLTLRKDVPCPDPEFPGRAARCLC